jgi:2-polyprenyl-6-methoxyphenol hydroxylase-like FAD-dependent oxidoreductase
MKRAIVSGGGIAGLSAAIALAKTGWKVDVFERSDAIREIGSGIYIKGNGLKVLRAYDLLGDLADGYVILREARIFDGYGALLQYRSLEGAQNVWNIRRQSLMRALAQRAKQHGASIHTGMQVTDISPNGTLNVNGTRERADLVVAADGVNSIARKSLGLDMPARAPRSGAVRLLIPRTDYEKEDCTREFWSGQLRIGVAPCTETEVYSYLSAPLDDERGVKTPLDEKYWTGHFPALASQGFFARAAKAAAVHHPYAYVRTRSWVAGKVALVGDAVHGLPPTLGQGAGLSLMNTFLLAATLAKHDDVSSALSSWEHHWRWVSDRTQLWSKRYDRITSEWPPALYGARDAIIWAMGRSQRFNRYMRVADRVDAPNGQVQS